MKSIQALALSFLMIYCGTPLNVSAQQTPRTFAITDGLVGVPYQASIPSVLRDKYRLRLETDAPTTTFRFAFASGEIPPGLVVRPSGTIIGTPRVARDQPYRFQVRVIDISFAGSEALTLDLMMSVAARHIRLAEVRVPRLTPIDDVAARMDNTADTTQANHSVVSVDAYAEPSKDVRRSFQKTASSVPVSFSAGSVEPSSGVNPPEIQSNSTAAIPNNLELIRPVLRTIGVTPQDQQQTDSSAQRSKTPWGKKTVRVDVANEKTSNDKVRGPARIELNNLNVLRYDIRVGQDVTFPQAPDLTLPFIPPIPEQKSAPIATIAGGQTRDGAISDDFQQLINELIKIETAKTRDVNLVIISAITATNSAKDSLESLVNTSDSILTTAAGPQAIIRAIPPVIVLIDGSLQQTWPDDAIEGLQGRLDVLKNKLIALPKSAVTGHEDAYVAILARVVELQIQLNGLKSTGTQGTAFREAQNKLRRWKPILVGIQRGGTAGFSRTLDVGCGFAFNTGKETKVKLIKRDRLAEPGAAVTEEEIVTVVCSSPLSVSAGFGFSNIDEREFVLVPSIKTETTNGQTTQTVISRFGFRSKSAFRTLPVVLLNTRVWEPTDIFALHLSTGAAVDAKTGEGGTELEYIVGPSISFWRSLFITPGLHFGRVNKLAGGFELDQEVPTGISTPPLEKTWKKAFVTTFTYKIK